MYALDEAPTFPRGEQARNSVSQSVLEGRHYKYRKETIDIEDVEFEEVDLEFDKLFQLDNATGDSND